jgi:hypothetical protein
MVGAGMRRRTKKSHHQLELPLLRASNSCGSPDAAAAPRPPLRLIKGSGAKKPERLDSRDAVVRVLIEAGADLLLRRISSQRAEEIRRRVDVVMGLFDRVDGAPQLIPALKRRLDELEALMRETRGLRAGRSS